MKHLFLALLILAGCKSAQQSTPIPLPPSVVENPVIVELKMPTFKCVGCVFPERYVKAFALLNYANTDEFESYFLKKRIRLSHAGGQSPAMAIKTFRTLLSQGDEIWVSFYWHPWSTGIGAWDVDRLKENTKFTYAPKPLAAHLLHEITHKYGWRHQDNFKYKFDNENSFPYAAGDEFLAFLTEKGL